MDQRRINSLSKVSLQNITIQFSFKPGLEYEVIFNALSINVKTNNSNLLKNTDVINLIDAMTF